MVELKSGILAGVLCLTAPAWAAAEPCLAPQPSLLFASCAAPSRGALVMLDPGAGVPDGLGVAGARSLVVTGSYTSGEKIEPEGMVITAGSAYDPYVQGWDGLLVLDSEGDVSVHFVERVRVGGEVFNLRETEQRRAFVVHAEKTGLSAIQSHLLVVDGKLDVRPAASAPRFVRRILFTRADGSYALFDSAPRALTLFEAGEEVARRFDAVMAFNLDMGSYDYCALTTPVGETDCGSLPRERTAKLSNVLVFTQDFPPR